MLPLNAGSGVIWPLFEGDNIIWTKFAIKHPGSREERFVISTVSALISFNAQSLHHGCPVTFPVTV